MICDWFSTKIYCSNMFKQVLISKYNVYVHLIGIPVVKLTFFLINVLHVLQDVQVRSLVWSESECFRCRSLKTLETTLWVICRWPFAMYNFCLYPIFQWQDLAIALLLIYVCHEHAWNASHWLLKASPRTI